MKSKEECIEYFKKEEEKIRCEVERLYVENKISEDVRNIIMLYMDGCGAGIIFAFSKLDNENNLEGVILSAIVGYYKNIICLMITFIEIDKLKMQVNLQDMKDEDYSNSIIITLLLCKVKDVMINGLEKSQYLENISVILEKSVNLADYPVEHFEMEAKKIQDYISYMKDKQQVK